MSNKLKRYDYAALENNVDDMICDLNAILFYARYEEDALPRDLNLETIKNAVYALDDLVEELADVRASRERNQELAVC